MSPAPDRALADGHERVKHRARRQFDRWAETYDQSWLNELVFFPTIRACQEEIARWRRKQAADSYRLLDVGCGTGSLLALLTADPAARELVGLDFSPEMASRAAEKLAKYGQEERLRVVHGDAEHLPLPDTAFDLVSCCHSFHHYPHQAAVMREFRRVLRPGGALILIDGFRDNVIGWAIFDVAVASIERHVHHAAWSEIRAMAAEAGFAELQQRKLNVLAPLLVNVATR
jgi:ubiquinone/menaquinone biosynthesis C-methylase UbiE